MEPSRERSTSGEGSLYIPQEHQDVPLRAQAMPKNTSWHPFLTDFTSKRCAAADFGIHHPQNKKKMPSRGTTGAPTANILERETGFEPATFSLGS